MQKKDDDSSSIGKPPYCCSNPNCRNVFSIPKVIKYYVCPICQTLVGMTSTDDKTADEEYAPIEEPQAKKIVAKPVQTQTPTLKPTEPKIVEPKIVEPEVKQSKPQTPTPKSIVKEEKEGNPSDQVCRYYLGYLSQRDKGEGIPETCVECNKSLDCMLSEYYKSENTVAEIKKWYHPKF